MSVDKAKEVLLYKFEYINFILEPIIIFSDNSLLAPTENIYSLELKSPIILPSSSDSTKSP